MQTDNQKNEKEGADSPIVIPVDTSADACVFEKSSNIIQRKALDELEKLVNETLSRIEKFRKTLNEESSWNRSRHHDVITLLGGRGSGKTTFMLNALNQINNNDELQIHNLGIIDPTLVECRESIFLNIISRIQMSVTGKTDSIDEEDRKQFEERLGKLATGVSELKGIGNRSLDHDTWDDPHFIMNEGLNKVYSGERLELDFHRFLDTALTCLHRKSFIMAFDDIDTDFSKGWDVLEIIRKYLTSPQLIILLTGDFDLYSNLVRMQQWKHFDKEFLDRENTGSSDTSRFASRVDSLENQYLLKILKPSRRIELQRLSAMDCERVLVDYEDKLPGGRSPRLRDELKNFLEDGYYLRPASGLKAALNHLERQSVRTLIQLLRGIKDVRITNGDPYALHDRMVRVFATPLSHLRFRWPDDILVARQRFGMNSLLSHLLQSGILEKGAELSPTLGSSDRNTTALIMGGYYATAISVTPSLLCDYYIKVLLTRDYLNSNNEDEDRYMKSAGLNVDEPSLDTARRYAAVSHSQTNNGSNPAIDHGCLRLSEESARKQPIKELIKNLWGVQLGSEHLHNAARYAMDHHDTSPHIRPFLHKHDKLILPEDLQAGRLYNTAGTLSMNITSWHRKLLNMTLGGIDHGGSGSITFLSAYQIIATVGLLHELQTEELILELNRYSVPQRIKMRSDESAKMILAEDEIRDDTDHQKNDDWGSFLSTVEKWKNDRIKISPLPLQVLADAWKRFQDTLDKIGRELSELHAGFVLHRFAVAWLNSILVEESLHHHPEIKFNPDHPVGSDRIYEYNYNQLYSLYENKNTLRTQNNTIFQWALSCPLWSVVLCPETDIMQHHLQSLAYGGEKTDNGMPDYAGVTYGRITFDNAYALLNTILVPQARRISRNTQWSIPKNIAQSAVTRAAVDEILKYTKALKDVNPELVNNVYTPTQERLKDTSQFNEVRRLIKEAASIKQMLFKACPAIYKRILNRWDRFDPDTDRGQVFLRALIEFIPPSKNDELFS